MVVRHSDDSWSPPLVPVSQDGISSQGPSIVDEIHERYGLRVTLMRRVFEAKGVHCVEVELRGSQPNRDLKAVWVGRKEFEQFRSTKPGSPDPMATWLLQAEQEVPEERQAWARKGWFKRAETWMLHELDRHGIQVTGTVRQLRGLYYASAILRVNTSQGHFYFKQGLDREPKEIELTVKLAERWPHIVPMPLAFDNRENWMLNRDYQSAEESSDMPVDFRAAASALAQLQIESAEGIEQWKSAACIELDLADLADFLGGMSRFSSILKGGSEAFSVEDMQLLEARAKMLADKCLQLNAFALPNMLVHPDFRYANLFSYESGYWITDWAETFISHPFLSMARFKENLDARLASSDVSTESIAEIEEQFDAALSEYLRQFHGYLSRDDVEVAFSLARQVVSPWKLYSLMLTRGFLDPRDPAYIDHETRIRAVCRQWISSQNELS